MANPPVPSNLDANQVLQYAFNDDTGMLRVESTPAMQPGSMEVSIDASYDNIAIKNPNSDNVLAINSDGSVNVNVVSSSSEAPITLSNYYQVDNVAQNASVTVLTYTVPANTTFYLNRIPVSSDSISFFDLKFNSATNSRKRLSYVEFNQTFDYSLQGQIGGYQLVSGTVITLIATNLSTGGPASFSATLMGLQT